MTVLCAIIGTLAAYCVERTDLPGRHVWAALVVIPFAIPDFVVSFGWSSLSTWVSGYRGAVLVMTLAVYPLVYLPVAASLRGADAGHEEIARSLGASRLGTFFRVTLGQARRAILGGCLLVALVILAEYGAFEILGYQTFTTEIFSEFSVGFETASACALSLVLVILSLIVMVGESSLRGAPSVSRTGLGVARPVTRRPSGVCGCRRSPRSRRSSGPPSGFPSDRSCTGCSKAVPTSSAASRLSARRSTPSSTAPRRRSSRR